MLSQSNEARNWLGQFSVDDQTRACALLDVILTVSRDEFHDQMRDLILRTAEPLSSTIGLYAEREFQKWKGKPIRLFKESRGKTKRARGAGPAPVKPLRPYNPEVGSEGIVAQLVTEICKKNRKRFLNHPGPDPIRKRRVHCFFVITDHVGSGKRVLEYLNAAWRVRSVRSWHSYGLLRFYVLAYSATQRGTLNIRRHPSRPSVVAVKPSPTLGTEFRGPVFDRMKDLCMKYDPVGSDKEESLGYCGAGALTVFAHGAPNTTPRFLHKTGRVNGKTWVPLFPSQIPGPLPDASRDTMDTETISRRLRQLGQIRLARSIRWSSKNPASTKLLLVLACLSRPPRFPETIARRTRLTIIEVEEALQEAKANGWIDGKYRLTDQGHGQLKYLKRSPRRTPAALPERTEPYYPTSLRAPDASPS